MLPRTGPLSLFHTLWNISGCILFSCIFIFNFQPSGGAKILLLPVAAGSHMMTFEQLARPLMDRGHELHSVVNTDCPSLKKLIKLGITNHGYETPGKCPIDSQETRQEQLYNMMAGVTIRRFPYLIKGLKKMFEGEPEAFLSDKMVENLKKHKFDLAIIDGLIFTRHMYILPYRLGIPYITITAVQGLLETGTPALPSFSPSIREGKYTDKMSFFERVHNTLMLVVMDRFLTYLVGFDDYVATYAPEKEFKTLGQLERESALWLLLNENAIDFPRVSLPHIINIGGINTAPAKQLNPEFAKIADSAKDGLVIVSFGSTVDDFPAYIKDRLLNDIKHVKQTVIWRLTGERPKDLPAHIHLVKWMPQNDLLGHPNTKVFVTHCGCNGQFEALYHGVPMVGLPIFGDQKYNAMRMDNKGMGIALSLLEFKYGEVRDAINEVLHNDSYTKAVKKHSAIFRSSPSTPQERMVYWIEHVLKFGHDHLRSSGVDMPWYQYWCIDVLLFLGLVISAVILVIFTCCYLMVKKCGQMCLSKETKKETKLKAPKTKKRQ